MAALFGGCNVADDPCPSPAPRMHCDQKDHSSNGGNMTLEAAVVLNQKSPSQFEVNACVALVTACLSCYCFKLGVSLELQRQVKCSLQVSWHQTRRWWTWMRLVARKKFLLPCTVNSKSALLSSTDSSLNQGVPNLFSWINEVSSLLNFSVITMPICHSSKHIETHPVCQVLRWTAGHHSPALGTAGCPDRCHTAGHPCAPNCPPTLN